MLDRLRSSTRFVAIFAICAGLLALVLFSPLLLLGLSRVKGIDWQQLSNIGQTYGAASAILSGIAIIGVVFSLLVQARQAKMERIRAVRERHMELLQVVLNDPEVYGPIIGIDPDSGSDNIRSQLFTVMWMNYGRMGYQMDVLTERSLRQDFFPGVFRSDLTRSWWSNVRELWLNAPVPERRARRFVEIADEEYRKAIASGPPAVAKRFNGQANSVKRNARLFGHWRGPLAVMSGIVIGMLIRSRTASGSGNRSSNTE